MLRTLLTHLSSTAAPSRQLMTTDGELVNIRRMSASTACCAKVNVQVKQGQPWQSLHPRHLSRTRANVVTTSIDSSPALITLRHAPFPGATVVSSI